MKIELRLIFRSYSRFRYLGTDGLMHFLIYFGFYHEWFSFYSCVHDFRLPPRSRWELRSSTLLHSELW